VNVYTGRGFICPTADFQQPSDWNETLEHLDAMFEDRKPVIKRKG